MERQLVQMLDGRLVPEARLTGWQSDCGASFAYSGKVMTPPACGLSPLLAQVRDRLETMLKVHYDSCLVNVYEDGKSGMRFHSDPLYDEWDPDTAVVSIGATRGFTFRASADHSQRWEYTLRSGDVVHMWADCQERLQHSVRVEKVAEAAGVRISLVYKRRLS